MRYSHVLLKAFLTLLVPAVLASIYIYHYPYFHGCSFPAPTHATNGTETHNASSTTALAPFRLLAYGDPQLEGDTSLPDPNAPWFPSFENLLIHLSAVTVVDLPGLLTIDLISILFRDTPRLLRGWRKRLDLLGNDLYLAHIHRIVSTYTNPTHISVLGDLLGSQWISDTEFERRADRFWNTVFPNTRRIPDTLTSGTEPHSLDSDFSEYLINVAGNHDVGYAGDINADRVRRFETAFGKVNYAFDFTLPQDTLPDTEAPSLRIVILNTMNMDGPTWAPSLETETKDFLASQSAFANESSARHATVLLTHVPFFKQEGICTDGPFWSYFPSEQGGGVMEQNHLSANASVAILRGLFGRAGPGQGVVLNGHDHEGCNTFHYRDDGADETHVGPVIGQGWVSTLYASVAQTRAGRAAELRSGVQEVTVRSMMGSYGGNAGLLSGWFDETDGHWVFEYADCAFGVQHIWWAVHVLDLVTVGIGIGWLVSVFIA